MVEVITRKEGPWKCAKKIEQNTINLHDAKNDRFSKESDVFFVTICFVSYLENCRLLLIPGCGCWLRRSVRQEGTAGKYWMELFLFTLSLSPQLVLLYSCYCRTWPRLSFMPTAACWRTSPFQFLFLWTRYQTWSFPHISLFQGAQVRLRQRQSTNILVTTASRTWNLFISEQSSNW